MSVGRPSFNVERRGPVCFVAPSGLSCLSWLFVSFRVFRVFRGPFVAPQLRANPRALNEGPIDRELCGYELRRSARFLHFPGGASLLVVRVSGLY